MMLSPVPKSGTEINRPASDSFDPLTRFRLDCRTCSSLNPFETDNESS